MLQTLSISRSGRTTISLAGQFSFLRLPGVPDCFERSGRKLLITSEAYRIQFCVLRCKNPIYLAADCIEAAGVFVVQAPRFR